MKPVVIVILISCLIVGGIFLVRSVDSQSTTMIERMYRDDINLSVAKVDTPAVDTVLSGPVFRVEYSLMSSYQGLLPQNGILSGEHHVWLKDDQLLPIFGLGYLSTNDSLDFMDGLINPEFRLDEESAEQFMSVLQEIMGKDEFEPVPVDAIQNSGNVWYFVNGDFLSYYKGFIVTVDEAGAVIDMEFELSMLSKDQ